MKTSLYTRPILIGSLAAAVLLSVSNGSALAQAQAYPQISNCMAPQNASQRQECTMQRQPFYQTEDDTVPPTDNRLQMNMDNGGGGTQAPVVPNTTGAPATTGSSTGIGF
jgi:hypothetical protein